MKQKIIPMAGCCMEVSLWQMIRDLCRQMLDSHPFKVTVADVVLEDDRFLSIGTEKVDESTAVWYLGAMVSFMSSGHEVFGGRGIEYQTGHRDVRLPVLCKEHRNLTGVLHSCIAADSRNRIKLSGLYEAACAGFESCLRRNRPVNSTGMVSDSPSVADGGRWPEEME